MTVNVINAVIEKAVYANYFQTGIGYNQYKYRMAEDLALNEDLTIKEYINLNQHRMHRVEKTYALSAQLAEQVAGLTHNIHWLILTEHWCGDASQSLPVLNKIAEMSNGKIQMKLVYRDQNEALMDAYLTNETRSIPKLIQLDEQFNVTGIWGPRPTEAQKLVRQLKSSPATALNYASELHLWYAKDKQQALEAEISTLLPRANLFCIEGLS